ncbi:MAG: TolC family protein [Bdellovibrio sp.]|nr:TolC family protein [Bdellovibrio sp.]
MIDKFFNLVLSATIISSFIALPSFAQNERFELKETFKPITLNQVIQQGLKENHDQKSREMQDAILELQWAGVWDSFWIPTLTLSLSTQAQRIARFRTGTSDLFPTPTAPTGVASLNFGDYTVFNWGKDYLDYLNNKQTIRRSKQILTEEKRTLKHRLIIMYFDVLTKKEIEVSMRDQLRHASFVYRLNREKVAAQKIARLDYQQARAEFLKAQQEYYTAKNDLEQAQEELGHQIDDGPGTRYVYQESLEYKDSKVEFDEAYELAKKNSPAILNTKVQQEVADRRLEKARRENLPLPKFTIDLGAYSQTFGRSTYVQDYQTSAGNSSIEMVATVNATWTLYGDAGFLNKRDLQEASLNKGIASRNFLEANDFVAAQLHILFDRINNYQKQIGILEPRLKNARKTFDVALDNYTKKKANFTDFLHALRDFTETEISNANTKFQHLKAKVELASMTGVEDFPGERFEALALKAKSLDDIMRENEDLQDVEETSKTKKRKKTPPTIEESPKEEAAKEETTTVEQPADTSTPVSEIQSETPTETPSEIPSEIPSDTTAPEETTTTPTPELDAIPSPPEAEPDTTTPTEGSAP